MQSRRQKQDAAKELLAARNLRTNIQQYKLLDRRLGKETGALKERARLWDKIERQSVVEN